MQSGRTVLLLASLACFLTAGVSGQPGPSRLPAPIDSYVTKVVKPTEAQRQQVFAGQPITKLLDADPAREVSVFGLVWVNAPIDRYVSAIRNIEEFEKGENFLVTKKVSSPPRLEDFARLTLPADDLEDLKSCRVGACELKLSEASLNRMREEIDWSKPTAAADANALARRLMLDYIRGYLDGGDARLATYRDSDRRAIGTLPSGLDLRADCNCCPRNHVADHRRVVSVIRRPECRSPTGARPRERSSSRNAAVAYPAGVSPAAGVS